MFIAVCDDVFNGYGLIARGETEEAAARAMYAEYRVISASWNDDGIYCKTFKAFCDHWGYNLYDLTNKAARMMD